MQWWRRVVRYPPTWLVLVVTVLAVVVLGTWFSPGAGGLLVLLALAVLVLLAWPVAVAATGTVGRLRRQELERADVATGRDAEQSLRAELAAVPDPRPLQQLDAVHSKSENLEAVLGRRLDAGEMTYARYASAGQQVVQAVQHNLAEVALAYRSVSTIDAPGVERRLAQLSGSAGQAAERERASLQARLELWRSQQERIAGLLAQNEDAMTAVDRTATTISATPMGGQAADAEAAMADLEALAERTARYADG